MKKKLGLFMVVSLMLLVLAACGGASSDKSGTSSDKSVTNSDKSGEKSYKIAISQYVEYPSLV